MSEVSDHPATKSSDFLATRESHDILIKGKAFGDYRVQTVSLVRAPSQPSATTLELLVEATLGPVQPAHPDFIREFDLSFKERPANRTERVKIVNGHQHFTIDVS